MRPAEGTPKRKRRTQTSAQAEAFTATATATAAAGQPQLTYSIVPTSVAVGAQQTFTFTATNPGPNSVTVQAITDSITLGNLSQLTATTVSPQTPPSPWQATPQGQTLQFWALSNVTLNSGQFVSFTFAANVVTTPGTATLSVKEVIGGNTAQAPALPVLIQNALTISAYANPVNTGQQRAIQLVWTTIGGEYVTISPGTGQQFPAGSSSTLVTPNQNVPQTTYTLTVYQGINQSHCQVTVNLCVPVIGNFQMTPKTMLQIGQSIQAVWATQYATQITMSPPLGQSPFMQAAGTQSFVPSQSLPANAVGAPYTITTYGYQGPVQQTLLLAFAPMRIRYLRYSAFPVQNDPPPPVIYEVFNPQPGTSLNLTATPILLTAVGPGGPATAQLGGTGPEVQVMLANPSPVPQGQSTVISYLVANVVTLTLKPGDVNCTFDSSGKGSVTVTPSQSTTYILVAVNGGTTVTSELDVTVS
jgi:hypothetical protein